MVHGLHTLSSRNFSRSFGSTFELSNNDYCIANAIYHLSNNPDSIFKGWYHGKVETLGKMFNLSRASAYNSINKLIEKRKI